MTNKIKRPSDEVTLNGYVCDDDRKLLFQRLSTMKMDGAIPTIWIEYRDGRHPRLQVNILSVGGETADALREALKSLQHVGPPKPWPPVEG